MNNNTLIKILYKTHEIQQFLLNDLFEELKNVINFDLCINKGNLNKKQREINYLITKNTIDKFLIKNKIYLEKLEYYFKGYSYSAIIEHIIIAFVYYMSKITEKFKNIDVFTSMYSICYNKYNYMLAI